MNDLDSETLDQIKTELVNNLNQIDDEILNYILESISLSKDDFETVDDVEETIGYHLVEISDEKSASDLCSKIFYMLKP